MPNENKPSSRKTLRIPRKARKKIWFWCSKPLGLKVLRWLLEPKQRAHFEIAAVSIAESDSQALTIEREALLAQIPVYEFATPVQPHAELGLSVGFPHRIPTENLAGCRDGCLNLHFAPLPWFRGSHCLTQAMLQQATRFGVSLHYMDAKLDTGPVVSVVWTKLARTDRASDVMQRLEQKAFLLLRSKLQQLKHTRTLPAIDQETLCRRHHISPQFCTRAQFEKSLEIPLSTAIKQQLYQHLKAVAISHHLPYFQIGSEKIVFTFVE